MKRYLSLSFVLFATTGCALVERVDLALERLGSVDSRLAETNRTLA